MTDDALRLEVERLGRELKQVHNELRQLEQRVDTVFSWPWKRLLWVLKGFRPYRVGRWYGKTEDLR